MITKSNSIRALLLFFLCLILPVECFSQPNIIVSSNGFIYYWAKEGGKYIVYDNNMKCIIPKSRGYEYIYFTPSIIYGGFFEFKKNGLYGICDISGKEIVSPKYDYIYQYKDDPYFSASNSLINLDGKEYRKKGKSVYFSFGDGFYYYDSKFNERRIGKINKKEHYRLIDLGRKTLRETRSKPEATKKTQTVMINDERQKDKDQKGFVWIEINHNGQLGVADAKGNIIIPAEYEDVEFMKLTDDMSCFKCTDSNGCPNIFTLTGTPIISEINYGTINFRKDKDIIGYFVFQTFFNDGKIGTAVYDLSGHRIVSEFDCYSDVKFRGVDGCIGYFKVYDGEKEGAVDIYGNTIIKPKKKDLIYYPGKGFAYQKDKHYMGIKLRADGTGDDSQKRQWDSEKSQRRAQMWANIIQIAAVGTQQTLAMLQSQPVSRPVRSTALYGKTGGSLADQMEQPGYFNNAFNQLLNVSAFQVQQQEMAEYNQMRQASLSMGKDLSYQEYCLIKGQAIADLKEQGYDIIAEQKAINDELHDLNRSMMNSGKENVDRIKQQNAQKYGTSTKSNASTQASGSYSTSSKSRTSSSTSYGASSNNGATSNGASAVTYDSHEQYKNGRLNTQKSSYGDKIKNVSMAVKDGASFRSVNLHGELYKKDGQYYVKIGASFFNVVNTGGPYNSYIIYGAKAHYFNR